MNLFCLSVLCLNGLCLSGLQQPALCQNSGGPGGGSWLLSIPTYGLNGAYKMTDIDPSNTTTTANQTWGTGNGVEKSVLSWYTYSTPSFLSQHNVSLSETGTVIIQARWVANPYTGTPPPTPSKVILRLTSGASWSVGPGSGPLSTSLNSHKADDGLGDSEIVADDGYSGHSNTQNNPILVRLAPSGGIATKSVTLTASENFRTGTAASTPANIGVSVGAMVDDREVNISSSVDTTYKRGRDPNGKPIQVANVPDPATGLIIADTANPADAPRDANGNPTGSYPADVINYFGAAAGSWHASSKATWSSQADGCERAIPVRSWPAYPAACSHLLPANRCRQAGHHYANCNGQHG